MTHWGGDKKILLLGDRGQLGMQLLVDSEHTKLYKGSDFAFDLTKLQESQQILEQICPDVVINCAAYTAVDNAEQESETAFAVNAAGPHMLAQWCASNNSHLVHISTDYVFPGTKALYNAYVEDDATGPISIYGKSKLLGEENIRAADDLRYTVLRTAWLYGASGNNFLKTMLKLVLRDPERKYQVVADQYGSPTSAEALSRQIQAVVDNEVFGTYHAASHGYCSWFELACEFFAALGLEHKLAMCTTEEYKSVASRPHNSILSNENLREINLDFFVHWRDDLTLFVNSYGEGLIKEIKDSLEKDQSRG